MTSLQSGLFLDTNILLDYCLPGRRGHDDSFKLIDACCRKNISLYCAVSSLKDVYYVIERSIQNAIAKEGKHNGGTSVSIAWGMLERICSLVQAVGVDVSDAWIATKYRSLHNDFEDNMLIAACERARAAHLITSDVELREDAPVSTLRADQALALLGE